MAGSVGSRCYEYRESRATPLMEASREYLLLMRAIDLLGRAGESPTFAQSEYYMLQALERLHELKGMIVVRDDFRFRDLTVQELMGDG